MRTVTFLAITILSCGAVIPSRAQVRSTTDEAKEIALDAPNKLTVKVRMEGPYDAETSLQVVCYLKHNVSGDKTLDAAVELNERLRGVISSLRNRGEFAGDELETLLLTPPRHTIKPKLLLLVGLGDEALLSLDRIERVGRTAVREAAKLGTTRIAFAPLIRDQGNSRFLAGDVANAVVRGMLLAYDTDKRLQKEGLAKAFSLEEWVQEAGPKYFADTVTGVQKAVREAATAIDRRSPRPYATGRT
jgi:hypothetical protein